MSKDYFMLFMMSVLIFLMYDTRKKVGSNRPSRKKGSVVLDTSALIDGRIVDVFRCGFMADSDIIIPKVVLRELQLLADGRDAHKRERARAGLEAAGELQEEFAERCVLDSFGFGTKEKTDELLLQITANRNARLCTTDYNLNQVAIVEKIAVLNVNELAQVMRPKILPGETITVKILQKGESPGQGVGYLEDGTMAVVDNTTPKMKNTFVVAKVERMIQTKAGKMVFARYEASRK
jgi:uncharacterized protein YacL